MLKLYKALIRPHLKYACPVWDPHLTKDIHAIESVQQFALRVCSKQWRTSYVSLLDTHSIPSLSTRRQILRLSTHYNIHFGKLDFLKCPLKFKSSPYTNRHLNSLQQSL